MEKTNKEKGRAAFILKDRLWKAQLSHLSSTDTIEEGVQVEEESEWFEVNEEGEVTAADKIPASIGTADDMVEPCPSKSTSGNRKMKAQFGRRHTHNEQTLVHPCGIIFARATMFGAEAVSNFLVCTPSYNNCLPAIA